MFDRSQFLKEITNANPHLGRLLDELIQNMDGMANHIGVSQAGRVAPPPILQGINVAFNSGTVHVVLQHSVPVNKGLRYFVEADTSPAFAQPHVFDLGASRTLFTALPNKDGSGNQLNWHFRAYSQYLGSNPSKPLNFGTKFNPTAVQVGGSAQFTPLASTGSGTAAANGQQGGQGLGVVLTRPVTGPKRSTPPPAAR
jgi:hypothetical protein